MEPEGVDLWICISLVPRRSRLGQSWTLLWALTSQKRLARPFPDFAGTMGQESCKIQSIMEKETAKASAGWRVCQFKRKSVPVMLRKELSSALRNLKRENRGLGRRGKLNDARMDKLQKYYWISIWANVGNGWNENMPSMPVLYTVPPANRPL